VELVVVVAAQVAPKIRMRAMSDNKILDFHSNLLHIDPRWNPNDTVDIHMWSSQCAAPTSKSMKSNSFALMFQDNYLTKIPTCLCC
jgi:hypothetical protein